MGETRAKPRVIIAGGGTAGWVAAAALSSQLGPLLDITLIESDQISTVGVGEATIPTQRAFHQLLGLDERAFMKATRATFKLGIAFENWGARGDRYLHAFGQIGKSTWMGDFHHMWCQARADGYGGELDDYSFELQAAEAGKFQTGENSKLSYAYHLDASLYAGFLRKHSEAKGVHRHEGKIIDVQINAETGHIDAVSLEHGETIEGDLFIDCTGFRALLIGQALGVGYDDWSHWLPMNSAVAMQTRSDAEILPYTRSIARDAGWQWRIPLQHRVGNGHVYCSDYMEDDTARDTLLSTVDGEPVAEPRLIRFKTGRRQKVWEKNCIALGLSSGFLEPLESTSIHLIQAAVTRLIQVFPFNGSAPALAAHFNAQADEELESIRDFIILHYVQTRRSDTPFWRDRQSLEMPDSLAQRIALYRETGLTYQHGHELFRVDSWLQVMRGQGLDSDTYHHMGQLIPKAQLRKALDSLKANIAGAVSRLPRHQEFLEQYCGPLEA